MKKFLLGLALVLVLASTSFAQWGSNFEVGRRYVHRPEISVQDEWWTTMGSTNATDSSLEFRGYNHVRIDYDITGSDTVIDVNLQCSNDSTWMSGDSSTSVSRDMYKVYDLSGCADYNVYIEEMNGTTPAITVYATPFNRMGE